MYIIVYLLELSYIFANLLYVRMPSFRDQVTKGQNTFMIRKFEIGLHIKRIVPPIALLKILANPKAPHNNTEETPRLPLFVSTLPMYFSKKLSIHVHLILRAILNEFQRKVLNFEQDIVWFCRSF